MYSNVTTAADITLALEGLNLVPPPELEPLESFHLFPALAPELRLKIWTFACFPRILPITCQTKTISTVTASRPSRRIQQTTTTFISSAAPPTLLSVCAEARAQALTIYKLSFATSTSPGTVYFSPTRDTLYFPRCREMGYDATARDFTTLVSETGAQKPPVLPQDTKDIWENVCSIALDYVDINIKRPWESYNKACLIRSFPRLEEVILVVGKSTEMSPTTAINHLDDVEEHGRRPRSTDNVTFIQPRFDPEKLFRWWAGFRQNFGIEERMLEDVCQRSGKPYTKYQLPIVKLVGRGK